MWLGYYTTPLSQRARGEYVFRTSAGFDAAENGFVFFYLDSTICKARVFSAYMLSMEQWAAARKL